MSWFLNSRITYFLQCALYGSFQEAAAKIGISQAALSIAIKKLEDEVGETLFERMPFGVQLTPRGEAFREVLRTHQDQITLESSLVFKKNILSVLRVGTINDFGLQCFLPFLDKVSSRGARPQVFFNRSQALLDGVVSGKLDFAFIAWLEKPHAIEFIEIKKYPVGIVGLKKYFSHIGNVKELSALQKEPWVYFPLPHRDWTSMLPPLKEGFVVSDIETQRKIILSGLAIGETMLDGFTVKERTALVSPDIAQKYNESKVYAVYRKNLQPAILSVLREWVEKIKEPNPVIKKNSRID